MFENFLKFKSLVEKYIGYFIKTLVTNIRSEVFSTEFKTYCEAHIVRRELIALFTPEQNKMA